MHNAILFLMVRLVQQRCKDLEPEIPMYQTEKDRRQAFEAGYDQGISHVTELLDTLLKEVQ